MEKIKIKNQAFTAFSWFAAWLFTISFLDLPLLKAILAIILWPYYIGEYIRAIVN